LMLEMPSWWNKLPRVGSRPRGPGLVDNSYTAYSRLRRQRREHWGARREGHASWWRRMRSVAGRPTARISNARNEAGPAGESHLVQLGRL
jgi:hypothetical protein